VGLGLIGTILAALAATPAVAMTQSATCQLVDINGLTMTSGPSTCQAASAGPPPEGSSNGAISGTVTDGAFTLSSQTLGNGSPGANVSGTLSFSTSFLVSGVGPTGKMYFPYEFFGTLAASTTPDRLSAVNQTLLGSATTTMSFSVSDGSISSTYARTVCAAGQVNYVSVCKPPPPGGVQPVAVFDESGMLVLQVTDGETVTLQAQLTGAATSQVTASEQASGAGTETFVWSQPTYFDPTHTPEPTSSALLLSATILLAGLVRPQWNGAADRR